MSWSSGKDCAWALHALQNDPANEVVALLTTVNEKYDRISMHGVRRTVLERQTAATGLPSWIVHLPDPCPDEKYEEIMANVIQEAQVLDISAMGFGDIFLEDVRKFRERQLSDSGIEPVFPLWQRDTKVLAEEMIQAGLKAWVISADVLKLGGEAVGRAWDKSFLLDLPENMDYCGERGEYHTFVWDGPMFREPIPVSFGERMAKDGYAYLDILPG
jgi:uncharacterized protein (TIGR00290 family)